tara:strand:- start:1994 stop:2611 length:618 start_codon:yes stop_codon:yes gene_type:complete
MPELPKISRMQFGVIDEEYMNTLSNAAETFNSLKPAIDDMLAKTRGQVSPPFLAQITSLIAMDSISLERNDGSTETVTVQWAYLWKTKSIESVDQDEIVLIDAEPLVTSQDISESIDIGQGGEWTGEIVSGLAFNMAELANKATYNASGVVFGVDVTTAAYPAAFYPVGIAAGNFVYLQKVYSDSAEAIYIFDRQGTHDGSCEQP